MLEEQLKLLDSAEEAGDKATAQIHSKRIKIIQDALLKKTETKDERSSALPS